MLSIWILLICNWTSDVIFCKYDNCVFVSKDQAKDARKLKKAAIHEDVPGMKKAALDAALNEGKRQAGEQLRGRGLANPVINEDAAGGNSIILSGRRNGGSFRAFTRGGSFLPHWF